jgi:hypothetical protein
VPEHLSPLSRRAGNAVAVIWWLLVGYGIAEILMRLLPNSYHPAQALLAIPPLGAGLILRRRSAGEPVAALLSFGFVLMAAWIARFVEEPSLGAEQVDRLIGGACLGFLIVAFAAFPDGRFVPRWTRWSLVLVPASCVALLAPPPVQDAALLLLAALLPISLAMLIPRLRRTPMGPERQQLKWAVFGFAVGLPMFVAGFILGDAGVSLLNAAKAAFEAGHAPPPPFWMSWLRRAGQLLVLGGVLMMPLGVIISLLRFRLNDIDAVMGRSSSFAVAAGLVALVWASGLALMESTANRLLGGENSALPKIIVALAAMALFAPSQKRVMQWMEARLRPAFVRLRTLPARLAQWQHGEDPGVVADGALTIIVDGIKAERGALVATTDGGRRILALHAIAGDTAETEVPEDAGTAESAGSVDGFPLVLPLSDENGHVGTILLGPRSDGATYRRDEREAVSHIAAPLADALRATTHCERRNAAFAARIEELSLRIEQLEGRTQGT